MPMRRKFSAPPPVMLMRAGVRSLAATSQQLVDGPPSAIEETSALERELGIKDGQLALGVDPNEVLKYIGT